MEEYYDVYITDYAYTKYIWLFHKDARVLNQTELRQLYIDCMKNI